MKFCKENLPVLIALKNYAPIVEGMTPLIEKQAFRFASTKTPTSVLDVSDYRQAGVEAILEAAKSFDHNQGFKNGKLDHERYWAKFLRLTQMKMHSKMISMQNATYFPYTTGDVLANLHRKVFKSIQSGEELSDMELAKKFDTKEDLIRKARDLVGFYETLEVSKDSDEVLSSVGSETTVQSSVVSDIFVEEMLCTLSPLERTLVERIAIGEEKITAVAKSLGRQHQEIRRIYKKALAKMKKELL